MIQHLTRNGMADDRESCMEGHDGGVWSFWWGRWIPFSVTRAKRRLKYVKYSIIITMPPPERPSPSSLLSFDTQLFSNYFILSPLSIRLQSQIPHASSPLGTEPAQGNLRSTILHVSDATSRRRMTRHISINLSPLRTQPLSYIHH